MRLELILSKESIYKNFTIGKDFRSKLRINENTLVVSNQLIDIWEKYLDDKGLKDEFENWFYTKVHSAESIKKEKLNNCNTGDDVNILTDIAEIDKNRIIVSENNMSNNLKQNGFKYINNTILDKEKMPTIKVQDINDFFNRNKFDKIFDLHETPITIDVSKNSDAKVLADYLALFYKNSRKIIIRDLYIDEDANTRNLKKYILPYIDKDNCEVEIQTYWGQNPDLKRSIERKFTNIDGYNVSVKGIPDKKQMHRSQIKGDKYRIDLGYRLNIFGSNDDNLTEEESIYIIKN